MDTARRAPLPGRAAVLLAAAVLGSAACSQATPAGSGAAPGGLTSPGPAAGAPQWEPQTAWERAVVDVDVNGEYSKDAALRLFATAFGPLPGVDVKQDLRGVEDRTLAVEAVDRHRAELTE